ncbi:ADP-ribosylglycohydrolase OS=Streptomyces violarus OX=67380 GN=FHS41_001297 PE=4 SV=1 [Streptomyces violarus]
MLSHTGNGVYGAMWAAALIAAAFTAPTVRHAVDEALAVIPASSRLARTVRRVVALHDTRAGLSWEDTLTTVTEEIHRDGLDPHRPELPPSSLAGLLSRRRRDFHPHHHPDRPRWLWTPTPTVRTGGVGGRGVRRGGRHRGPVDLVPLEDTVRSAVFGLFDGVRISELA